MVEIDLVRGRPALKVRFQISLAADLLNTLSLVISGPSVEGFDQWVYATHAALPPTLKDDIELVLVLTQKSDMFAQWLNQLRPDNPVHYDFGAFSAWFNALTEEDFQGLVEDTLKYLDDCSEEEQLSSFSWEDAEELRACLGIKFDGEQLDRAIQMIHNPVELKALFSSVLTRFWEQFYSREYGRCLPLMERSVELHRRQNYSADLSTVFTAVTGRRLPDKDIDYEDMEQVIFIPSGHIGPYVIFKVIDEPKPALIVHYNCRPSGVPEGDQALGVQDLFPPIKALADETRLQILSILDGQELYAQEIVAHLDISQSAVSRHLKLMVTGGLLTVRKEDSMKYYSINKETLDAVADRLKSFRAKST